MKKCKCPLILFISVMGLILLLTSSTMACGTAATPAEFKVTSLSFDPTTGRIGEPVNIIVLVNNIGKAEGAYEATLLINGLKEQTKVANVAPGESETITFSISEGKAGTYNVEVGGLTGTLIINPNQVSTYSNPQIYRVVRTITIQNENAGVDSLRVWIPAVGESDSQKNVVSVKTTPPSSSVWKDPQFGTAVLFWELANKPVAGSSLVITDEFTYTCYEINCEIALGNILAYDKTDTQYILYTRPEKYIESADPNIVKTAKEIIGDKTNPYEIAQSLYKWVIEHMAYQKIGGIKGAKFAFDKGYGECGDYSALFVALCRADGIPARPIVGRWATSKKEDWHVWTEFYMPGYGWVPVDASIQDLWGGDYFGHIDNKRLIFNKQYNVDLHPGPNFFPAHQSIFQTWLWEYQGFPGTVSGDIDYSITPTHGGL